MSEDQKQPKQRLNIRVRRGLTSLLNTLNDELDLQVHLQHYKAKEKGDVEAALRWIAENKQ
jgi:hypothetical protein